MLEHFLSIEDLNKIEIEYLLTRGDHYLNEKKFSNLLQDKLFFNVFFEESTRTISSFQTAATKLGASVINLNMKSSSASKGETEFDSIKNIAALGASFIAMRHSESMMPHLCARQLRSNTSILNAGDGCNEHPTQALGDLLTIVNNYKGDLKDIKIVICGDIKHNRVAHSHIKLYNILGIKNIHLVAPPELMYDYKGLYNNLNYHYKLEDALPDADIIMSLRFKKEYIGSSLSSGIFDEFKSFYSINHSNIKLAKKNVLIMHPGPVNRGIELSGALADDLQYSLILQQVASGVAMRQAIIEKLFYDNHNE